MSVDWARVERWHGLMLDDDIDEIRQVFAADGARGPRIEWDPAADALKLKPLQFTLDHWNRAVDRFGTPTTRMVDPIELVPALGYLLLVDVLDGGIDFNYRLYGSIVSSVSGLDMTGKRLSDHPASPHIRDFSLALYRAVIVRREPVWSQYGPAAAISTSAWERVIMPLVDDEGRVCRFLVAIVPIGLDGHMLRG
jgi:hypothetical protein